MTSLPLKGIEQSKLLYCGTSRAAREQFLTPSKATVLLRRPMTAYLHRPADYSY